MSDVPRELQVSVVTRPHAVGLCSLSLLLWVCPAARSFDSAVSCALSFEWRCVIDARHP